MSTKIKEERKKRIDSAVDKFLTTTLSQFVVDQVSFRESMHRMYCDGFEFDYMSVQTKTTDQYDLYKTAPRHVLGDPLLQHMCADIMIGHELCLTNYKTDFSDIEADADMLKYLFIKHPPSNVPDDEWEEAVLKHICQYYLFSYFPVNEDLMAEGRLCGVRDYGLKTILLLFQSLEECFAGVAFEIEKEEVYNKFAIANRIPYNEYLMTICDLLENGFLNMVHVSSSTYCTFFSLEELKSMFELSSDDITFTLDPT